MRAFLPGCSRQWGWPVKKNLLVVDNDKAIRDVLQLTFETLGYQVFSAEGGEKGELLARQFHPDCIILDVMMPDKNGYVVCMELKRDPATAHIPIILLTAKSLTDDIHWGYDSGADAYVTKPYEPRELEALVEQLIGDADRGQRSITWTGLPDAGKVLEEARTRLGSGGEVFLAELSFPNEPKEVLVQKYGQAKFRMLIHSVAWKIFAVIRKDASAGLVGQRSDNSFLVLIHPSEADRVESQLQKETAPCIDAFYDPKERAANSVTFSQQEPAGTGMGTLLREAPLLRLQWKAIEAVQPDPK